MGWHGSASWPKAGEALMTPERLDEGSCSCPPSEHFPNKPNTGYPRVGELGLCAPPRGTKEQLRRERMLEHGAHTWAPTGPLPYPAALEPGLLGDHTR